MRTYKETGLYITPSTQKDYNIIESAMERHGLQFEQYGREFFLPEEEETYDQLEQYLDGIFSGYWVDYQIEGVF